MSATKVDTAVLFQPQIPLVVDVRSPGEFAKAHIPGAVNLPLFSDEERCIVGTAYKQLSPEKAMLLGLEFAGQKMRWYVENATALCPEKKMLLHCWRGGKRSESLGWLLSMAGFDVKVLKGGYKNYRKYVHTFFETMPAKFVVIGGQTGIGKTMVLNALAEKGEQVIDLEQLASHRGSAFGSLGQSPQPTTEHFENLLFKAIHSMDFSRRIFIENESHVIGKCQIPITFFQKMKSYQYIQYSIPEQKRIENLLSQYACFPKEALKERFEKIKKKLGGDQLKIALQMLDDDDFAGAAQVALRFYDKTYLYGYENNQTLQKINLHFDQAAPQSIADKIIQTCNELEK
ncbi:MAG: tRNA 2-selenouridine(34) synthase MnmH [Chitinophagaceae bacterium]|nr:tRNA 2-selenouridine(34) synthase MnmH [Chitinophagaceae bacterium]